MRVRAALGVALLLPVFAAGPALAGTSGAPVKTTALAGAKKTAGPRLAAARASRGRAAETGVKLSFTKIDPKPAVGPDSTVTIKGVVRNATGQPLSGLVVALHSSPIPLSSRAELGAARPTPPRVSKMAQLPGPIAAGATKVWSLQVKATALQYKAFGVYPISVTVSDAAGRLAELPTFLTFVPKNMNAVKKTKIAWVWPLIDRPHQLAGNDFTDDDLANALKPSGRLEVLTSAAAHSKTPVTWAIDPLLVSEAQLMTKPYTAQAGGAKPSPDAQSWLGTVRAVAASYFPTPYADPDAVALVRQGATAQLDQAYNLRQPTTTFLGPSSGPAISWPADGLATQKTLNQLAGHGPTTFLLSSAALAPDPNLTYTPDATSTVHTSKGTRTAVAYDSVIASVISGDTGSTTAQTLAEQRFLAETAMMTSERPTQQRSLVVAPADRRWNPSPTFAKELLSWSSHAPWLQSVSLQSVATARTADARTLQQYTRADAARELNSDYVNAVLNTNDRARNFGNIYLPPRNDFVTGVLNASSSYWRTSRVQGLSALDAMNKQLNVLVDSVKFGQGGGQDSRRLVGRSGVVPFSISNGLNETIRVKLWIRSTIQQALQVCSGRFQAPCIVGGVRTIPPHGLDTVPVPMEASVNRITDVEVQVLTPDGKHAIGPVRIVHIDTNGLGLPALLITGGGLAVIFFGVGVRAVRARRRRRETEGPHDGHPGAV
ncbi:MAG: hypothetical protein JWN00_4470 [Actinomycetia bacterium]|nr:hypothetical protein [Actinomycetes bacterium]